jgi:hypothetical protein
MDVTVHWTEFISIFLFLTNALLSARGDRQILDRSLAAGAWRLSKPVLTGFAVQPSLARSFIGSFQNRPRPRRIQGDRLQARNRKKLSATLSPRNLSGTM